MENASKALIMAGGILIALMILGALMLMFNNLSSYQKQNDELRQDSQIAEFNNQFMPYEKDELTLMELKTLYNKVKSNNSTNPESEVTTNIEGIYPDIIKSFSEIEEDEKITLRFKCDNVEYDSKTGKINKMTFSKK